MTFRLWPTKSPASVPPLVILSSGNSDPLRQAADLMKIPVLDSIPGKGDFILATFPGEPALDGIPIHIPRIDATAPNIQLLLEAALLYLEAHNRIRK